MLRREYLLERGQLALVVIQIRGAGLVAGAGAGAGVAIGGLLKFKRDGAPLCFSLLPRPYPRAPAVPQQCPAVRFSNLSTNCRKTNFEAAVCPQEQLHIVEKRVGMVFVPFHQLLERREQHR